MISRSRAPKGAALLAILVLAACQSDLAGPDPAGLDLDPQLAIGDYYSLVEGAAAGLGFVCAFLPDGEAGTATFSASATGGDVIAGDFDIVQPGSHCIEVWNATDGASVELTASVESDPAGLTVETIATLVGAGPTVTFFPAASSITVDVSDLVGASIWFKFKVDDAPPVGGEGCTPGYWKQSHHFDSWMGYAPTDLFSSVFDDAFPGETLVDVAWARGGGVNALGRHAVAALLNAAHSDIDYDLTEAQVIDAFNTAYATGDRRAMNEQKDIFDLLNNQGCELN